MFEKFTSILVLFRVGASVVNPAQWKQHQITVTMLGGLFIALAQVAKVFGYDIPIDADTATAIAGGIIAAVNFVLTLTTSDKIGIGSTDEQKPT